MKNKVFAVVLLLFLFPLVSAASFSIDTTAKSSVIIADTTDPARFILTIDNKGPADEFRVYSLGGVEIKPSEPIAVGEDETKLIEIEVYPLRKIRNEIRTYFVANYEVYGENSGLAAGQLKFKIVDIKDMLEVSAANIVPSDTQAIVTIQNLEDYAIDNAPIKIKSPFFEVSQQLTLKPYEKLNITVPIDAEKGKKVVAGVYDFSFNIVIKNAEATKLGEIKYLEKEGLSVREETKGFVARKYIVEKKNEGNLPVSASVTREIDILSRLVTTYTETPSTVTKKGFYVTYVWNKELQPSESLIVTTTTNYTLPLVFIILLGGIIIAVKFFTTHSLQVQKRVHAVKTRGGEFALKVSLHVKARSSIKDISLTDRVPHAMKLYEKFGIAPHKVNEQTNTLHWSIPHLNAGEERVFSYVIYSKLGVEGNFELPLASASFQHNGKHEMVHSNKTGVMAGVAHNE